MSVTRRIQIFILYFVTCWEENEWHYELFLFIVWITRITRGRTVWEPSLSLMKISRCPWQSWQPLTSCFSSSFLPRPGWLSGLKHGDCREWSVSGIYRTSWVTPMTRSDCYLETIRDLFKCWKIISRWWWNTFSICETDWDVLCISSRLHYLSSEIRVSDVNHKGGGGGGSKSLSRNPSWPPEVLR